MMTWRRLIFVSLGVAFAGAHAGPGEGVQWEDWLLRPYLTTSLEYDSNVFLLERDEEDDWLANLRYGLNLSRMTDAGALVMNVWGASQRYDRFDEQDHDDWGADLFLGVESSGNSTISLQLLYADVEDVDYQSTSIQDYELFSGAINAGTLITEKLRAEAGYEYKLKSFELDDLFDWNRHLGSVEITSDITDHSAALLLGQVGVLDSDGNDDRGVYYNTLVGVQSRRTEKIVGKIGVGVVGLDSDDKDLTTVGWLAEVDWRASPLWTLTLASDRVIEPASISRNNYHLISSVSSALRYRPVSTVQVTLRLAYRHFDLQNDFIVGNESREKQEDIYLGSLRLDYLAPGGFFEWFIESAVAEQVSTIDELDYSQLSVLSGVTFRY